MQRSKSFLTKLNESYEYFKTSLGVQVKEFFQHSTLHGVKYIAANDRPFIERFMWFICVTTGTVASCAVIFSLWDKFQTNPTITGLDTNFHDWQVPFPAITLCPAEPADMQSVATFLGLSSNASYEDDIKVQYYYDLSKLSFNTVGQFQSKHIKDNPDFFDLPRDIKELTFKLMDKCVDVFDTCKFKDEPIECCGRNTSSFYPVLTEVGWCYTFNSRHFEKGDKKDVQFNMQYIKETDVKWSLEFSVNSRKVLTSIYITNPDDMISIDVQPQLIWDYRVEKIAFSIKQTYTTEDTRQLSIKQRKCVFEDEIKLKVDKIYSYTACAIQCRMQNIRDQCGCLPFFYPIVTGFKYCSTVLSLNCLNMHLQNIMDISKCDCQLGCKNTVYEVESQNSKQSEDDDNVSKLEIGFVSWPMVRYKREVLFGWVDLLGTLLILVSFGGIAGLFLGFSLLSGVEIVYYFTIRACIAAFRERKFLDRVRKQNKEKLKPMHDLSLVPYFVAEPLPGQGIDIIAKQFDGQAIKKSKKNKVIKVGMMPPFGIEFLH